MSIVLTPYIVTTVIIAADRAKERIQSLSLCMMSISRFGGG